MNSQVAANLLQAAAASGGLNMILLCWLVLKTISADRAHDRLEFRIEQIEAQLAEQSKIRRSSQHVHQHEQRNASGVRHQQPW